MVYVAKKLPWGSKRRSKRLRNLTHCPKQEMGAAWCELLERTDRSKMDPGTADGLPGYRELEKEAIAISPRVLASATKWVTLTFCQKGKEQGGEV